MVGRMLGMVMCLTMPQRPRPSTAPASYSSWSMPAMADMYRMVFQPMFFQIFAIVIIAQKYSPSCKNRTGSSTKPTATSRSFKTPSLLRTVVKMLATTTHETKYGR